MRVFPLYPATEQAFVQENRLVSVLCHPANRHIEPLRVVRDIVVVEGPEVLFMRKQVHDLCRVRVLCQGFQRFRDPVNRDGVADYVNPGENDPALEILSGIVSR
jgi:hypothetical protein